MKRYCKEQLKILLLQENMLQKELAELITEKSGKLCKPDYIKQRMYRKSFKYDEMVDILDYLGYKIKVVKKKEYDDD
ncbi:hypothetical protein IJV79_00155 [bacterium]|nr:hypothetical protein [bacterium]